MKTELFIYMLFVHFLADFTLQTSEQAVQKSSSNKFLAYHVGTYSLMWLLASFIMLQSWYLALIFSLITFVCHFITDYATSRIGKPFWEKQDYHNGFVVVGFDQLLHYVQLHYTFELLMKHV